MSQVSPAASADKPVYPAVNYLNADRGIRSWLLTLDHKRIAVMYFATAVIVRPPPPDRR